jgi:undecaprenyl-diphosphatase
MSEFDSAFLEFLNQFSERSWTFDNLVVLVGSTALVKGYLVLPLFWWAWFRPSQEREEGQRTVILTLLAGLIAVALARSLQIALPYRPRPLHTAGLHFIVPYSAPATYYSTWSSFPSDHASLFFALATGLCLISPFIGALAMLHAGLIVSLPRIYLGLHFPTDILSGALIGIGVMTLIWNFRSSWRVMTDPVLAWSRASPQTFFPCFFLLTAELAHLFEDTRELAETLWHIVKPLLGR